MAVVKFPIKELEKYLKIDESSLKDMSMFGALASISGEDLEVEINLNRPDLIPMQGFVRALRAFQGKETKKYKVNPSKYLVKVDKSVEQIRPFTACAVVKNLSLNNESLKEIINMQEKLHITLGRNRKRMAIGIYPLEKIKFPITYEAKKPSEIVFAPLGMEKEIDAHKILKTHPAGKEYSDLLEDYDKYPVFTSDKKVLSMPPIINSNEIGRVEKNTKEIFIECSGYDKTLLKKALNIMVTSLADLGGSIHSVIVAYGSEKESLPDLTSQKVKLSLDNLNSLLGTSIKEKEAEKLLKKMGYEYKSKHALAPAWRTDIMHEVDIIEDIAIAYGYQNLVPQVPQVATIGEESKEEKIKNKISELLIGLGLLEISSLHLIKPESNSSGIMLENSRTEYKVLRENLLVSALKILGDNKDKEYPQNIFEIGRVFAQDLKEESGVKEKNRLILALTTGNFTNAKQYLEYLFKNLSLQYSLKSSAEPGFIEGRTAKILFNEKAIGYIGEAHPNALKDRGLKMPLAVIEIDLDNLIKEID